MERHSNTMALDLGDIVVASGAEAAGLKLSSPPFFLDNSEGRGRLPFFCRWSLGLPKKPLALGFLGRPWAPKCLNLSAVCASPRAARARYFPRWGPPCASGRALLRANRAPDEWVFGLL